LDNQVTKVYLNSVLEVCFALGSVVEDGGGTCRRAKSLLITRMSDAKKR
jgi:hypothetical protein